MYCIVKCSYIYAAVVPLTTTVRGSAAARICVIFTKIKLLLTIDLFYVTFNPRGRVCFLISRQLLY